MRHARELRVLLLTFGLVAAQGCDDESPGSVDETVAGSSTYEHIELCEIAFKYDGGAGLYHVTSIFGVLEEDSAGESEPLPFTYVELTLDEDWSGAAATEVVVRMAGGPISDTMTQSTDFAFSMNERVGLFTFALREDVNAGFAVTGPQGIFREQSSGGFANEYLYIDSPLDADELAARVGAAYNALPDVLHDLPYGDDEVFPRELCPEETLGGVD